MLSVVMLQTVVDQWRLKSANKTIRRVRVELPLVRSGDNSDVCMHCASLMLQMLLRRPWPYVSVTIQNVISFYCRAD